MRLLIIEDDPQVSRALQKALMHSYVIDVASSGEDGLYMEEVTSYELILLDLMLPDINGLDICAALRGRGCETPILILTGQGEVDDKVHLLDAGADDYLTKPFQIEELQARVRALLRRHSRTTTTNQLVVDTLRLNVAERTVEREGKPIRLRRKEYDLLEYLMRNTGKTLTHRMILDHVWSRQDQVWVNAIAVTVKYLRDKIDRPFSTPLIQTVHGVGYKLEATVLEGSKS